MRTITARTEVIRHGRAVRCHGPLAGRITAEGRVVAYPGAEVTVGTEVLGTIINMPALEKAAVRKGDLLVELRADDVRASLREAHFRLIEAEAGLRFCEPAPSWTESSPAPTGKAPQAADHRAEEHAAAVARRDAAKAAVDRLEAEAAKYRITAPIDGVVIARHVDPGETVTPGSPLVTIVDLSRLRVEAEVDEFDIAGVALSAQSDHHGRRIFRTVAGRARSRRSPTPSSPARLAPKIPAGPPTRASCASRWHSANQTP